MISITILIVPHSEGFFLNGISLDAFPKIISIGGWLGMFGVFFFFNEVKCFFKVYLFPKHLLQNY